MAMAMMAHGNVGTASEIAHGGARSAHGVGARRSLCGGPLFIGGLAHSGKTPLRLALSAHGGMALSRRTDMWNDFYGRFGDLAIAKNFERCLAAMLARPAVRALCDDAALVRERFRLAQPSYGRLFAIFHEAHAQRTGRRRWGEQAGSMERYADAIFETYPDARFIHMVRDPRDVQAIARRQSRFRPGKVGWSTAAWRASVRLARRNEARYAGRYMVLTYERLLAQPEEALRGVCDFIGEPFREEMVEVMAASMGRKGVELEIGDWRLGIGESAFVEAYAREEMATFGYLPRANLPRTNLPLANLPLALVNRAAMGIWEGLNRWK